MVQEKRVVIYGIISICLVVIGLGVFCFFRPSPSIPEVFATPYRTAVEQEYRLQYEEAGLPIPSEDFWTTEIGGRTPRDVLEQKQERLYQEFQLIQLEAKRIDSRVKEIQLDKASWQEVSETMATNRQLIKDNWVTTLSEAELRAYYQKNLHHFSEQAPIRGRLSFWQNGMESWSREVDISAETVRMVTEQYPELDTLLPTIEVGESKSWQKDGGIYQFLCIERQEGLPLPFQEVVEAVASQLVEEKLNDWLDKKLGG